MNNKSILRKLQLYMLGFGIAMGFIFPLYASFFVNWKEGMFPFFAAGCIMAGITVGLVSFWFVKIILLKKLKEVSDVANQIENKNLSNTISFNSNDDVGTIVTGINQAITNIRELFIEMAKVFAVSEQALEGFNTDEQSTIQQSALEKINHAIAEVTESTKEIEFQNENIFKNVTKGRQISECTFEKQKETIAQVNQFADIMNLLVKHSQDIYSVLAIIEDIASQTNILSLNASVEAARAGESGKGFAVVANEIRKLATNTSESSHSISNTINLIQNEVEKANKKVNDISDSVGTNNDDIESIIKQFTNINKSLKASFDHNHSLTSSVDQLNHLFNNVQTVFDDLNKNLNHLQAIMVSYTY